MRPQNEELLYFLLWTAEGFLRPTWRNLDESFESWAWRRGLARRLTDLARQRLIEHRPGPDLGRVVRLTEAGKRLALGGRDPTERWSRPWDGLWRLVLFDLPSREVPLRQRLRRILHRDHFGYLQNSVWITPDPADPIRETLRQISIAPDVFIVIEGRPASGEPDQEIVRGAWNFDRINQLYARYLTATKHIPSGQARLVLWLQQELSAWRDAVRADPMLPMSLLPADYLGQKAYQRRKEILAHLATL